MRWKAYKLAVTLERSRNHGAESTAPNLTDSQINRLPDSGKRKLEVGEASAGYPITTHGPTMAADLGTANASFPKIKKQFVILGKQLERDAL